MLKSPILILSDESTEFPRKVVGAISIPLESFYELEDWFTKFRVDNKLFGEVKWEKIQSPGKYLNCYLDMIQKTLSIPGVKFHSNCYSGGQYKASYALVRSISWKLSNYGYHDSVAILFDELSCSEVDLTRDYLNGDRRFRHDVLFCTESDSTVFTTMQVVDLICGSLAYKINKLSGKVVATKVKDYFVGKVDEIDGDLGIELNFSPMWAYSDPKKIQNFDL